MSELENHGFSWISINRGTTNLNDMSGNTVAVVCKPLEDYHHLIWYESESQQVREATDFISAQKLVELSLGFDPGGSWKVKGVEFSPEQALVIGHTPVTWIHKAT